MCKARHRGNSTVAPESTDKTLAIEDTHYVATDTIRCESMQDVDDRMHFVAEHHGSRPHHDSRGGNDVYTQRGAAVDICG